MSTGRSRGLSRREFLGSAGLTTLALGSGALRSEPASAGASDAAPVAGGGPPQGAYNVLFILTDQERHFDPSELPPGYTLPGRERLQRRGVTFTQHQINSAVCTSSRSVIYTGRHIQHTKLFDNIDVPWMDGLSHEIPTLGHLLDEVGYHAAYLGKWHLSSELGTDNEYALPQEALTRAIESYGFHDYVGIGDVIGHTQGGYLNDGIIGAQARRWLRLRGQSLTRNGTPWFLAVNLVNPHDVMFYNTDAPGQEVQARPPTLMAIEREPNVPLYRRQWDVRLPESRRQPFDAPGRPPAHGEYQRARGALVGTFPNEDARWRRLLNYYFNCIAETDLAVAGIVEELDALGIAENTIVVMTADHGELGGAHGTHGKGATTYREQNHVPLIVAHPGHPTTHGQRCGAVTTHLDLVPTLLRWTGAETRRPDRMRELRGHDLTPLLDQGATAGPDALRVGSLYCFNMIMYVDSELLRGIQSFFNAGGDLEALQQQGLRPDLRKRGAIRSVFDGRYKFSRYFSPRQHNQPRTLEGLFALNDVELFDLEADPVETRNLALDPKRHGELLLAMNQKMNTLIEAEVGAPDDGSFLPGDAARWVAATFDP